MSIRIALAAGLMALTGTPAIVAAQTPASQETPAQTVSEEELEAMGEAFEERMEALKVELSNAIDAAQGDRAKLSTDVDAILATYQPEIEVFISKVESYLDGRLAAATDEKERQELATARASVGEALRGLSAQIKAATLQQAS